MDRQTKVKIIIAIIIISSGLFFFLSIYSKSFFENLSREQKLFLIEKFADFILGNGKTDIAPVDNLISLITWIVIISLFGLIIIPTVIMFIYFSKKNKSKFH